MSETTYTVAGMTCGHCVGAVESELANLPGVRDVDVGAGRVRVVSDHPLDDAVRAAVEEAGYEVTG